MDPTLLVPLDGSQSAETALHFATLLARRLGAQLVLLRAALAHTRPSLSPEAAQVRAVAEAKRYLRDLEAHLQADGYQVRSVVPYGPAAEVIVDNAELQRADLIVMAVSSRRSSRRWEPGSVADRVLRSVPTPVVLVRHTSTRLLNNRDGQPGSILIPLDGSEAAEAIALPVIDLARRLQAPVTLLAVLGPIAPVAARQRFSHASNSQSSRETEMQAYMVSLRRRLEERGVCVRAEVRVGTASEQILTRSQQPDIALVALSTRRLSGISRWAYGSVAGAVIHGTDCPLLLVRATETHPDEGIRVLARRCHNCGRVVQLHSFSPKDRCPLCGFHLRSCANCAFYDGVICDMDNPRSREVYVGTECPDFRFRGTLASGSILV